MKRSEKEVVVNEFSEKLTRAKALILAEYRGLKVSEMTEIRKEVRKNDGEIKVIKNRLSKKSVAGSNFSALESYFRGPLAIAISEKDPVVLSKVLSKFSETYPALKLKAAFFDGKVLDAKGIDALSKLPSKEELYAKMLGSLLSPAQSVVRTLNGVSQKLVRTLQAIADKK